MKFHVRLGQVLLVGSVLFCGLNLSCGTLAAQDRPAGTSALGLGGAETASPDRGPEVGFSQMDLQRLAAESAEQVPIEEGSSSSMDLLDASQGSINFLSLLLQGGVLMIPIALMSLLVVAVILERLIGLRGARIFPRGLRRELRKTIEDTGVAAPQMLYDASRRYPSAASRMLQDVLQKVGRPIPEIETAINEGAQREADRLYGNVRWLTLAAAVTPLIGLLGTVWGMIIAFYNTTQLGVGGNKAEYLAKGIYIALVTTLGGLAVAIPAAIFAHFFEGRISRMLSEVETELKRLVPKFESLEGKARYDIGTRGLTRRLVSEMPPRRKLATPPSGASPSSLPSSLP